MNDHMKNHEDQIPMPCLIEGCSDQMYLSHSQNNHTYNLPNQFYEHLDLEHQANMTTHIVWVEFKCKHCDKILTMKCSNPEVSKRFVSANAKIWSTSLTNHISNNHATDCLNFDIKRDWKLHYVRSNILLKERIQERDLQFELGQILGTLKCKLCDFSASGSYQIQRNPLLKHYCLEHFTTPMREHAKNEIDDNFCKTCDKQVSFNTEKEKLVHIGYIHAELYPFLKSDSEVDLTPYAVRKPISKISKPKQIYKCDECRKVFRHKSGMKAHMIYHSDKRPFSCEHCQKGFKTPRDLKLHVRTHPGESPYKCKQCGKNFAQAENMRRHIENKNHASSTDI